VYKKQAFFKSYAPGCFSIPFGLKQKKAKSEHSSLKEGIAS